MVMEMPGDRYIGMTFVYDERSDARCPIGLYMIIPKIVEAVVKNYDSVSGYLVKNLGGIYIDGEYAAGWIFKEKPDGCLPRRLDESRHKIIWVEEMKDGIENLKNIWLDELGRRVDEIVFRSFPPKKYLDKYGVEYEEKFPYPMGQKEGPWVDIVTRYNTCYGGDKQYVALDFGTYENYFYSDDERLNRAMDEFLVDLMRDIASATKPAYAYMNTEEFKPLEFDPMCRNMKEMVKLVRRDGIYTVWSDILWVPKNAILNEFTMEELKIVEGVAGKKWEIVVEEHDDHLFLYPMKPISNYEYVEYRYKNRRKEEKLYRELELPMLRVCGDIEQGVYLDLSYLGEDALKKYRKRILDWSRKYGIRVINLE